MAVNAKTIFKNTSILYIRMIVTMVIGLVSVPIVLRSLGETDYGVYNVVSGIVTMLGFINYSLASTTQRFLSFELGKANLDKLKLIFSNSLLFYIVFSLLVVVIGETIGVWFINSKLNIPETRMTAANWIFQFSIVSFVFSVLSAPFNAAIIAHEKMQAYAYICIGEAVLKLLLVLSLLYITGDKLIIYGAFLMAATVLVFGGYYLYCRRNFAECTFKLSFDKNTSKSLSSFAGWSIWGAFANVIRNQGVNIILNQFYGVLVNAARGLAFQIDSAINTLVQNFYSAVRPQIVKSYAEDSKKEMNNLVMLSTRIGFYLVFFFSLIMIIDAEFILSLWLHDVPNYTVIFTRLAIIGNLVLVLAQPLTMVIHATGKVARYQFISGLLGVLVLPVSYYLLKVYDDVLIPFLVIILNYLLYYILSLERTCRLTIFPLRNYLMVILRMLVASAIIAGLSYFIISFVEGAWVRLIFLSFSVLIILIIVVFYIDMNYDERIKVKSWIANKILKK